ncbi:uncharacterized protein LOC116618504 isoform X2 [Nematostella vectensis]|uniref:uncharacterized protein LOC116618504 isoform X2 n=1 Tax=Nematostella vectensis TaxID=45351 RepID=UPI0020771363|nr:uncharacterized protein LOC116618504 isoform X2 [Nematostella vectensis]
MARLIRAVILLLALVAANSTKQNLLQKAEREEPDTEGKSGRVVLEQTPHFKTVTEEVKWKLNKARRKLRIAKGYVLLAQKAAKEKKKGTSEEAEVKDIIHKAEVEVVHAGEGMGLDYVHFKRDVE